MSGFSFSFRIKQPEYLLDYSQVGVYSVHRSRICWFNEPSVYSRALNGSGFCFFEFPEYGRESSQRGCVLAVCVGDFPLPPAILTPSLAYAILSTEPYGGWRDGNCTLSCINHISALFLSESSMCLFPDNAALSSAENSLEKFSSTPIILTVKRIRPRGLRTFACSRKSLCF